MAKLFFSYSHKDEVLRDTLQIQLEVLRRSGAIATWHDRMIRAGDEFDGAIDQNMQDADVILLLVSPDFLASSYCFDVELKRAMERHEAGTARVIPVILRPCDWQEDTPFKKLLAAPKDGRPITKWPNEDEAFLDVVKQIRAALKAAPTPSPQPKTAVGLHDPAENYRQAFTPRSGNLRSHSGPHVRLCPVAAVCAGGQKSNFQDRTDERASLTKMWDEGMVNLVCIEGIAGGGKSALVSEWMDEMRLAGPARWHRVFEYSFDREGPRPDYMIAEAICFFGGDSDWRPGDYETGKKLAKLASATRTLIVLDGLEQVMRPRGRQDGTISQKALQNFIRLLAGDNLGLCVVTTRQRLGDVTSSPGTSVRTISLESLPPDAAAELLFKLKVNGTFDQRNALAKRWKYHCLCLRLLGELISSRYGGNIGMAAEVALFESKDEAEAVSELLGHYETWLSGKPALDLLFLIGLFDQAEPEDWIDRLRIPRIAGLTDRLASLSNSQIRDLFAELKAFGLCGVIPAGGRTEVDSHPLIRNHFRERLRSENPKAWCEANERLFREAIRRADIAAPESDAELERLYEAVSFACRAGQYEEALIVFKRRIRKNTESGVRNFNLREKGAFDTDLRALREFYTDRGVWLTVTDLISPADRAYVAMEAGCDLRAQGNLSDSAEALRIAYELALAAGAMDQASDCAGNRAELETRRCNLCEAEEWAHLAISFADRADDLPRRVVMRGVLGNVLHLQGRLDDALLIFESARLLQFDSGGAKTLLAMQGFEHAYALLSKGRFVEAMSIAETILKLAKPSEHLFLGLAHYILGFGGLASQPTSSIATQDDAIVHLDKAWTKILESKRAEYRPRADMARAATLRFTGQVPESIQILAEAIGFAEHHELRLALIDLYIERADARAEIADPVADDDLKTARSIHAATPYGLRAVRLGLVSSSTG